MQHTNPKAAASAAETAVLKDSVAQPLAGAVARIFVRPDASRHALQELEDFLKASTVAAYATGNSGSPRMGYWYVIDVTDRRDLDLIRARASYLIDGWQEFD